MVSPYTYPHNSATVTVVHYVDTTAVLPRLHGFRRQRMRFVTLRWSTLRHTTHLLNTYSLPWYEMYQKLGSAEGPSVSAVQLSSVAMLHAQNAPYMGDFMSVSACCVDWRIWRGSIQSACTQKQKHTHRAHHQHHCHKQYSTHARQSTSTRVYHHSCSEPARTTHHKKP